MQHQQAHYSETLSNFMATFLLLMDNSPNSWRYHGISLLLNTLLMISSLVDSYRIATLDSSLVIQDIIITFFAKQKM